MKRTLLFITLTFAVGLYIISLNINENLLLIAFFVLAFVLALMFIRKKQYAVKCLAFVLALLAGMLSFAIRINLYEKDVAFLYGQNLSVLGRVYEVKYNNDNTAQLKIKTQEIKNESINITKPLKVNLLLDDYKDKYKYGDIVSFNTKFTKPESAKNFGEFDLRIYLMTKGIKLSGYTKSAVIIDNKTSPFNPQDMAYKIKSFISENIDKQYFTPERGLVKGILIGDTSGLDDETNEAFRNSGLSHVVAVSGMHLTIIVMIAMGIFGLFRVKMRYTVLFIYLGIIWLFVLIVGAGVSVLRAAFMTSLFFISKLLRKQDDSLTSLALSVLIILIISPSAFFDIGFRLSVGATLTILIYTKPIEEKLGIFPKRIRQIIAVSCSSQIGIIPILMLHFGTVPVLSVFTNLLIAPLAPLIMGIGTLGVILSPIPYLSSILVFLTSVTAKAFIYIAKVYSSLPFATITLFNINILNTLIYALFSIALYNFLVKEKARGLVLTNLATSVLVIAVICNVFYDTANVTFLNVGNGDCALIKAGSNEILIDSGGDTRRDVANNTVIPYLKRQGIKKIDVALLTHYHYDHGGAFVTLIKEGYIKKIILPNGVYISELKEEIEEAAKQNNTEVLYINDTDTVKINEYTRIEAINAQTGNDENSGMVYSFAYGKKKVLFTGDVTENGENKIVKENRDLSCDILKVSHHGSKASTSDKFLNVATPKVAVITCGKNSFGHPSDEVLKKLLDKSIYTYRTDLNGTIIFTLSKNKIIGLTIQRSNLNEL